MKLVIIAVNDNEQADKVIMSLPNDRQTMAIEVLTISKKVQSYLLDVQRIIRHIYHELS